MRGEHKRVTHEDKFGRKYYCQRAARTLIRYTKHLNHKIVRRYNKAKCKEEYDCNSENTNRKM